MPPDTPVATVEFGVVLEACRQFLLGIANDELPPELRAKGGASDLVQEALAEAHLNRGQFYGQSFGDLRAWLRGILLNQLRMFRRRFTATEARDIGREVPLVTVLSLLPATGPNPADELVCQEDRDRLSMAIEKLPEKMREVVHLRHQKQLYFDEIGHRLQRSEVAAYQLYRRAVVRLRAILRQHSGSPQSP